MAEDNPFADPADVNPFADPSVVRASQDQQQDEDYNPFEGDAHTQGGAEGIAPPPTKEEVKGWNLLGKKKDKKERPQGPERPPDAEPQPAVMQPAVIQPATIQPGVAQPFAPPAYTPYANAQDEEILRKESEIAQRERELAAREARLARIADPRPNNFPPLPKRCPVKPCFYHNIKEEIPASEQWVMRAVLVMWLVYFILLALNSTVLFLTLILMKEPAFVTTFGTSFGISLVYFFLCPGLSLLAWYMPLYRAYRKDSSLFFMWFMFIFVIQGIGFIINAAGFINLGSCGWWLGSLAIQNSDKTDSPPFIQAMGAMMVIMGFLWVALAIFDGLIVFRVHRYYRASGGTLQRAQEEALRTAASSKTVRSAARQAVVTGMQAATSE